jgi:hypothetical protein
MSPDQCRALNSICRYVCSSQRQCSREVLHKKNEKIIKPGNVGLSLIDAHDRKEDDVIICEEHEFKVKN